MDDLRRNFNDFKFTEADLPDGHELRFTQRLDNEIKPVIYKRVFISIIGYAVAASIGLLLFLTIVKSANQLEEKIILASAAADKIEEEVYLQNEVESRLATIQLIKNNKKQLARMMADIIGFDNSLEMLKTDLNEAPGDQRIVDAVITTYLMKIEALDNIVHILQKTS